MTRTALVLDGGHGPALATVRSLGRAGWRVLTTAGTRSSASRYAAHFPSPITAPLNTTRSCTPRSCAISLSRACIPDSSGPTNASHTWRPSIVCGSLANASSSRSGLFFEESRPRKSTSSASPGMPCFLLNSPLCGNSRGAITPFRRRTIFSRGMPPPANSSTSCSAVAMISAAPPSIFSPNRP